MSKFVTEKQAEALAVKHIENYLNECNCQSMDDAKKAAAKMLAVSADCFDTIKNGSHENLQTH